MSALMELRAAKASNGQVDWFHRHADDMIVKRKIVFFSVTIKVRDLYPLFTQLFGPEVENTTVVG